MPLQQKRQIKSLVASAGPLLKETKMYHPILLRPFKTAPDPALVVTAQKSCGQTREGPKESHKDDQND